MIVKGLIVPGKPHPLLAPEKAKPWGEIRKAYEAARAEIDKVNPDVLVIYSTQWLSVIGHQIQADPNPKWTHVDHEWHDLGTMPYEFRMDAQYAEAYERAARARGLHTRRVNYHGFPIDTGTVVALKLLNPDNKYAACVVSCNMYADRAETLVLGKAAADAVNATGKRAVAIAVTGLSHRLFTKQIEPSEDRIYSLKDDEWNRKLLELLGQGRLEDVSQVAREFSNQASGDQKMKALWWLAAFMGQHNRYEGKVHGYQPIWGTGAAVVSLTPGAKAELTKEFDEEDVEFFRGNQNVLKKDATATAAAVAPESSTTPTLSKPPISKTAPGAKPSTPAPPRAPADANDDLYRRASPADGAIRTDKAPKPVGAYPHARRVGDLLYLSGVGPRQPGTNEIPGGPVRDSQGKPLNYDVAAQTHAVIKNVKDILEASGSSLENVLDVSVFLIDMDRDFPTFNKVYAEYFGTIQPTRTTVAVTALPTPIAVELKVIAKA
ncbi:MAG TPA: Rid family hydrolase [Bdellovibrionales bacterium]|nr:Rid family hydrolase [Bdellovibrionales bacterium]